MTFIGVFEGVVEYLFTSFVFLTDSHFGLSLFLLSLSISIALLPLQLLIRYFQRDSREKKLLAVARIDELERCYSGRELINYKRVLYRQCGIKGYKDHLSLLSILLQIPFFIAAFNYLTRLPLLRGQSSWGIENLAKPDQLISFAGISINFLPILMTIVSVLSAWVFTQGDKKRMLPLLWISAIFFVLLYLMPSSLLIYWTSNNIIALLLGCVVSRRWLLDRLHSLNVSPVYWVKKIILVTGRNRNEINFFGICVYAYVWVRFLQGEPEAPSYSFLASQNYMLALSVMLPLHLLIAKHKKVLVGVVLSSLVIWLSLPSIYFFSFSLTLCLLLYLLFSLRSSASETRFSVDALVYASFLIPLINYATGNLPFILEGGYAQFLGYLAGLPLAFFLLYMLLLRVWRIRLPVELLSALFLAAYLMPKWHFWLKTQSEVSLHYQLLLLAVLMLLSLRFYRANKKRYAVSVLAMIAISILALGVTLYKHFDVAAELKYRDLTPPRYLASKEFVKTPHLFFLIYDSYVGPNMMDFYGIDNDEQYQFLEDKGFVSYGDRLSTGDISLVSQARILSLGDEIEGTPDVYRTYVVGNNMLENFMKSRAYDRRYLFTDYFNRGVESSAIKEFITPNMGVDKSLLDGVIGGEFKFDIGMKGGTAGKFKRKKAALINQVFQRPSLFHAHSPLPGHSQNSGSCRSNETELFETRLRSANIEMKADIEAILKFNPNSIIVIAGDHAAYLKADCIGRSEDPNHPLTAQEFADIFGIFVAIRWPDNNYKSFDQFYYLQGVYHAIFAYMTQDKAVLDQQPSSDICRSNICADYEMNYSEDGVMRGRLFEALSR